jgi:hypothetical protein
MHNAISYLTLTRVRELKLDTLIALLIVCSSILNVEFEVIKELKRSLQFEMG